MKIAINVKKNKKEMHLIEFFLMFNWLIDRKSSMFFRLIQLKVLVIKIKTFISGPSELCFVTFHVEQQWPCCD